VQVTVTGILRMLEVTVTFEAMSVWISFEIHSAFMDTQLKNFVE
jgi:hypothetical protein